MATNILTFPAATVHRLPPERTEPASVNRSRRIHLCDRACNDRTHGDRTHGSQTRDGYGSRSLDLASQVDLTVSHVHRRMAEDTARAQQRRYFDPSDDTPDIPA